MLKFFSIGLGGIIGALLRYLLSGIPYRYLEGIFPYGTLSVNLLGALGIGFLWGITEEIPISPTLRSFLFIGMLGSFTTFSTYTLETFHLLREREIKLAFINILISNFLGIGLVFLGFMLSKGILPRIERKRNL